MNGGTIATRRWSSTLLTGSEDADGNGIRLSMEFYIVELGNGKRHCEDSTTGYEAEGKVKSSKHGLTRFGY